MEIKEVNVGTIPTPGKDKKYELHASAPTKYKMPKNKTMVLLDRTVVNRLCCCKKKIGNTYNSVINNLLDKYENEQ